MQALAHAVYPTAISSQTAVAVGIASAEYNNHVAPRFGSAPSAYSATGGALSVASGRLSFVFGFKGPAMSVDTACSSSLVASHLAATAVFSGTASGGLVAGVGLLLSPDPTTMFQKAGMLAPDGRCKSLDASADGYVRGEAAGVLVLQATVPAAEAALPAAALALFRGSSVNQDGRSSSLTAPNGPSQQEVVRQALRIGGLAAAQLSHLQLHGTGTPLGDPIEVGAAAAVLVDSCPRELALAATTAKSWIGHTEAAAGAMGLAHTALALASQLSQGEWCRCATLHTCCRASHRPPPHDHASTCRYHAPCSRQPTHCCCAAHGCFQAVCGLAPATLHRRSGGRPGCGQRRKLLCFPGHQRPRAAAAHRGGTGG